MIMFRFIIDGFKYGIDGSRVVHSFGTILLVLEVIIKVIFA